MKLLKHALAWALLAGVAFAQIPITQLPPATLPLSGTEQIPMVQNNKTVQAPANKVGTPITTFNQITALWTPPCNSPTLFLNGGGTCTNPSTPPGGNNNDVQFNAAGSFGGSDNLTFSSNVLTLTGNENILGASVPGIGLIATGSSSTNKSVCIVANTNSTSQPPNLTGIVAPAVMGLGSCADSGAPAFNANALNLGFNAGHLVFVTIGNLGDPTALISNYGPVFMQSGSGSTDSTLQVRNNTPSTLFQIFGDGHGTLTDGVHSGLGWTINGTWNLSGAIASQRELTINGSSNAVTTQINSGNNTLGNFPTLQVESTGTTGDQSGIQIFAGTNNGDYALQVQNATGTAVFEQLTGDGSGFHGPNASHSMSWTTNGAFSISAPTAGTALSVTAAAGNAGMLVTGVTGASALQINGPGSGGTVGLAINTGGTSADELITVGTQGGTQFFNVFGDGHGQLGPNVGTLGFTWNTSGAFSFLAPSAGTAVAIAGHSGSYGETIAGAGTGTVGLSVTGGSTSSDIVLDVENSAGTTKVLRATADGSVALNNSAPLGVGTINVTNSTGTGYGVNGIPQFATFNSATGTTVSNTDTYLGNFMAIPVNSLAAGNAFEITVVGQATSTVANTVTFTVRYGTAGTTADASIGTAVFTAATSGSGNGFRVKFYVAYTTIGSSGAAFVGNELINTAGAGISTNNTVVSQPGATTSCNTTTSNKLGVSLVSSAATTNFKIMTVTIQRMF